jgi:hypothetical protein
MKLYRWITNLTIGVIALACSGAVLAENLFYTHNLSEAETYSYVTDTGDYAMDKAAFIQVSIVDTKIPSSGTLLDVSSFSIGNTGFSTSFDNLMSYVFSLGSLGNGGYMLSFQGFSNGVWGKGYNVGANAVPLPVAVWLFSAALLGFAIFSSRRSI